MRSHSAFGRSEEGADVLASSTNEAGLEEPTFFAAQIRAFGDSPLSASAKVALHGKVEASLHHLFQVPQLVDGLTDYLSEVVSEDSRCAALIEV